MSKIEYSCEACGKEFVRVVIRGQAPPAMACPKCHNRQCVASMTEQGLFEGIMNFSSLAKNRD